MKKRCGSSRRRWGGTRRHRCGACCHCGTWYLVSGTGYGAHRETSRRVAGPDRVAASREWRAVSRDLGGAAGSGRGATQLRRDQAELRATELRRLLVHVGAQLASQPPAFQSTEVVHVRSMHSARRAGVIVPLRATPEASAGIGSPRGAFGSVPGTRYRVPCTTRSSCPYAALTGNARPLARSITPPPSTRSPSYSTADCPGVIAVTGSSSAISISSASERISVPRASRARWRTWISSSTP